MFLVPTVGQASKEQSHHSHGVMGMEDTHALHIMGSLTMTGLTSNGADSFCPYPHNSI